MEMILDIVKQLRAASSDVVKRQILALHKDNNEWKNFLISVYSPYINYNTEAKTDIDKMKLLKSIDAGVSVDMLNQIYGDIIPVFGEQKVSNDDSVIQFPCIAQYKYDGESFTCVVDGAKPKFYNSKGEMYELEESIFDNMESGVYLGMTKDSKFHIFEYLTLPEFYAGKAVLSYENRWLRMFNTNLDLDFDISEVTVEGKYCKNKEDLDEFCKTATNGVIIRQPNHLWHNDGTTTKGLVKEMILIKQDEDGFYVAIKDDKVIVRQKNMVACARKLYKYVKGQS